MRVQEYLQFGPKDQAAYLLGAKLCLNHLGRPAQALDFARKGAALGGALTARCQLARGVALLAMAQLRTRALLPRPTHTPPAGTLSTQEQKGFQLESIETLHAALQLDASDVDALFYLAVAYAQVREVEKALALATQALARDKFHAGALLLAALLHTARKDLDRAGELCRAALKQHPDDLRLLEWK